MGDGTRVVRAATGQDATACARIYAPFVTATAVSFEDEPPGADEMGRRIALAHRWLVLEDAGVVAGYAYAGLHKPRAAYRWACEVSVYVEPGRHRAGGGRTLYEALLAQLADRGFRVALAGMTLPNAASVGLHRALGFEPVGVYRRVGWKHGAWHDVAWMQRALGAADGAPDEPRP